MISFNQFDDIISEDLQLSGVRIERNADLYMDLVGRSPLMINGLPDSDAGFRALSAEEYWSCVWKLERNILVRVPEDSIVQMTHVR